MPPTSESLSPIEDWAAIFLRRLYPMGGQPLAWCEEGLVCLLPDGDWVTFTAAGSLPRDPIATQRAVLPVLVRQLGGTSAALGERIGLSPRTVEDWRSCRRPLPFESAWKIAGALIADAAE